MNEFDNFIRSLETVDQQAYKNLGIHFLRGHCTRRRIRNFDEAIDENCLKIDEIDGGHVPELRFLNNGDQPVFVPEGSIIVGLRQNRAVRVSFIINHNEELVVPVHCIEENRWGDAVKMGSSPFHLDSRLRAMNVRSTSQSLRHGSYRSSGSQGDTWNSIRQRMTSSRTTSKTSSLEDVYQNVQGTLSEYLRSFRCPDNVNGFLALIDGHVVTMEVFGSKRLLKRNFKPLISGLVIEAVYPIIGKEQQQKMTPEKFMETVLDAKKESYDSIGQGKDLRLEGDGFVGDALILDGEVMHMEAFAI